MAGRPILHRLFDLGVIIKGIDSAFELAGGLMFLLIEPRLNEILFFLTTHEISENHGDLVATLLRSGMRHLSSDTTLFAGVYLLGHGLAKALLVVSLLRGKLWAFPAALSFLGVFVTYQIYRIHLNHSFALAALTGFDLIVMSLIWHEYRFRKQTRV